MTFLRRDDVAGRFGHLLALAIDHEAVRQQGLVRRVAVAGAAGQQTGLEPAAMLVGAFQIQVGRVRQAFAFLQQAGVGDAGIEPDIQRVLVLDVKLGFVAQQFSFGSRLNQASMPRCSTRLATCSSKFRRARMQFASGPCA
jgi:hypothetical protein